MKHHAYKARRRKKRAKELRQLQAEAVVTMLAGRAWRWWDEQGRSQYVLKEAPDGKLTLWSDDRQIEVDHYWGEKSLEVNPHRWRREGLP